VGIIGVIGAMDEEVAILKEALRNREEKQIAGSLFFTGTISDKQVVLLKSGIGKVNAAMGATLLNQIYQPACVINTGSAGGFDVTLNVGDVVVSTEVTYHDVDVTAFGYTYGQVPQMPATYKADDELVLQAIRSAGKIIGIQAVTGLVATGDSFMNDANRVAFIRTKFPDLSAVEMEAAAIAQVCYHYRTPFVIIRALSDIAGKESDISFEQFLDTAAKHSAEVVLGILDGLKGM
jgi:adenosylhomocysteine nucleosidase